MESGCHVIVEVPLCDSMEDCAASSASADGEPLPVTHREREGRQQSALVTDLPRAELRRFVVSWA